VLLVLAVWLLFFTNILGDSFLPFLPKLRLQRSQVRASSTVTLETVRDLYEFTTVEYIHRAVFPYDYLPDGVSLNEILVKLRNTGGTVRDTLEPDELLYFNTYNLASDIGMSLTGRAEFVVVTVVISAGFDLSGLADTGVGDDGDGAAVEFVRVETIQTADGERRRAIVTPPGAVVTDVIVEDITAEEYPYPDVALSAEAWGRVASYVQEEVRKLPQVDEILETADRNGRAFVEGVLLQAGYDEVVFGTDPEPVL
jgi:hypothetical protein